MRHYPFDVLGHWNHAEEGVKLSSNEFYAEVERRISEHQLKDVAIERVKFPEGSIFSAKREYLQVTRKDFVFHVCAAPFGNGCFVSWWFSSYLDEVYSFLMRIPFIGWFFRWLYRLFRRETFYRHDTASMFQSITKVAVDDAFGSLLTAQAHRPLSEEELKPIMKELFAK